MIISKNEENYCWSGKCVGYIFTGHRTFLKVYLYILQLSIVRFLLLLMYAGGHAWRQEKVCLQTSAPSSNTVRLFKCNKCNGTPQSQMGARGERERKKKSILTYAELTLLFLSESCMKNTICFFFPLFKLVSFRLPVQFPFQAQRKKLSQKKGRGQDSDHSLSLSPTLGNRKGTRLDFKAGFLAPIPVLTPPTYAHTHTIKFLD